MKRICVSKTGAQTPFYSHAQGNEPDAQEEMIGLFRSSGRTLYYYVIADTNTLEGL